MRARAALERCWGGGGGGGGGGGCGVPRLESDLEEANMKWVNFVKECLVSVTDVERVPMLVADVASQGRDVLLGWLCGIGAKQHRMA